MYIHIYWNFVQFRTTSSVFYLSYYISLYTHRNMCVCMYNNMSIHIYHACHFPLLCLIFSFQFFIRKTIFCQFLNKNAQKQKQHKYTDYVRVCMYCKYYINCSTRTSIVQFCMMRVINRPSKLYVQVCMCVGVCVCTYQCASQYMCMKRKFLQKNYLKQICPSKRTQIYDNAHFAFAQEKKSNKHMRIYIMVWQQIIYHKYVHT